MWCFFYEPHRLPRSYVKWIYALANLDGRLITTLQYIRDGSWSYISGSPLHASLLRTTATKHGHPASWGNPNLLPAYGGAIADEAWKRLGVTSRPGVGGLPCEVLHASVGKGMGLNKSCTANAGFRTSKGFLDALAIYLPVCDYLCSIDSDIDTVPFIGTLSPRPHHPPPNHPPPPPSLRNILRCSPQRHFPFLLHRYVLVRGLSDANRCPRQTLPIYIA